MMRSLSSGVAGLRTHQTKMDVIGNNIANVNTFGFKASRATFADVYYQNLGGASSGSLGVRGGQNPTQIGYGSSVATVDVMNTVSSANQTDRAMDIFIAGDGFIASKDQSGNMTYTRFGNLGFDAAGNLVDGNGNLIQGFPMVNGQAQISPDGTIAATDLVPINCDTAILDKLTGISISPSGAITGVLQGDKIIKAATVPGFIDKDSISISPDSNFIGAVNLTIGALPTDSQLAAWFNGASATGTAYSPTVSDVQYGNVGLPAVGTSIEYTFTVTGKTFELAITDKDNPTKSDKYVGTVQDDGTVVLKSINTSKIAMSFKVDKAPASDVKIETNATEMSAAGAGMDKLKYQMSVKDEGENTRLIPDSPAEFTLGTGTLQLDGIGLDYDTSKLGFGPMSMTIGNATYDENVLYPIGNLAFAKFRNPGGMESVGSSYFAETANSGPPVFVKPGSNGTGKTTAGSLEMSNVDVSKEMTDMITTQRGFQANSRIITVSDTMLEELVNLKR